MADATTARGDTASRNDTPRLVIPALTDTRMIFDQVDAFSVESDVYLDQAYALLDLLRLAYSAADEITTQSVAGADGCDRIAHIGNARGYVIANAMEGVQSLIGLARYFDDKARVEASNARLDQKEGR